MKQIDIMPCLLFNTKLLTFLRVGGGGGRVHLWKRTLKGRSHYNDKLHDNDNDKGGESDSSMNIAVVHIRTKNRPVYRTMKNIVSCGSLPERFFLDRAR